MAQIPITLPKLEKLSESWQEREDGSWVCYYRHDIWGEVHLFDGRWGWRLVFVSIDGKSELAVLAGPTRPQRLLTAMRECDFVYEQIEARFSG